MKQEMTMLQSTHSAGEYLAPSVRVKELRTRRVLCASGYNTGSNQSYGEGSTDEWYNND